MAGVKSGLCTLLLGMLPVTGMTQSAGDYAVPRTVHGHPDLQGFWATHFIMPFERPEGVTSLIVSAAQSAEIAGQVQSSFDGLTDPDIILEGLDRTARVRGQYRSSIVVTPENGSIPYSEAGLAQIAQYQESFLTGYDHPEQRPLTERCIDGWGSVPARVIPIAFIRQIVQTRDHLLIRLEDTDGLRILPLRETAPAYVPRSISGYSMARWEGDTLVVTTSRFISGNLVRDNFGRPIAIGPDTRVEERLTRVSAEELVYLFTVTDPLLYTTPWSGEYSLYQHAGPVYEYACHEGNRSLPGILLGGRTAAATPQ